MGDEPKDSLDLTVEAFVAELDRAGISHAMKADHQAARSAMQRALPTCALLHRTPDADERAPH
jgi:hypothetical protein